MFTAEKNRTKTTITLEDRTVELTLTEHVDGEFLSAWLIHDVDQNFLGYLVYQDDAYEAHVPGGGVYRPYARREKALAIAATVHGA